MGLPALARIGESRRHRLVIWCCGAAVLAGLAACGGGGENTGAPPSASGQPVSPSGSVQPGELPSELLLGEPRGSPLGPSEPPDSVFTLFHHTRHRAGVELRGRVHRQHRGAERVRTGAFSGAAFTLQHNGAPAFYVVNEARAFELRYADGFFLFTAHNDNATISAYKACSAWTSTRPACRAVPPWRTAVPRQRLEVCSNSLGFISMADGPGRRRVE